MYPFAVQTQPKQGGYHLAPQPVAVTRVGTPFVAPSPPGTTAVVSAAPISTPAPSISISTAAAPGPPATSPYPASPKPVLAPPASAVLRVAASPSRPRVIRAAAPQPAATMLSTPSYRQATPMAPTRIMATGTVPTPVTKVSSPAPVVGSYRYVPKSQVIASSTRFTFPTTSVAKATPVASTSCSRVSQAPDVHMMKLKELHSASGLENVHVAQALPELKAAAESGMLRRENFIQIYTLILQQNNCEVPSDAIQSAVFDLFDRDQNNVVDVLEVLCGLSVLCAGGEDEKIHAVFHAFDENNDGYISLDEMAKFITALFKVSVTPGVMEKMASLDVPVTSLEDLAMVTALDCFKAGDATFDNRISREEFKAWLFAPRADPGYIMTPLKKAFS